MSGSVWPRWKIVSFKRASRTRLPVFQTVYGGERNRWQLTIISDCFTSEEQEVFIGFCHNLADKISQTSPFNRIDEHEDERGFRVEACFVPSDKVGPFKSENKSERRVFGDFGLVQDFLDDSKITRRTNDMVLVLANLPDLGGAGESQNENISWVTPVDQVEAGFLTTSWMDIALHEIGHAFELDDEYEDPWPGAPEKAHKNVFVTEHENQIPDANAVPWAHLSKR